MPFGNKSKEELFEYSSSIIDYLLYKHVDVIIIACGTICSTVYLDLQKKYNINIINIINETIKYINDNNIDNIGVIATTNTVKSNIFTTQLGDKNVYTYECPKLASLVEENSNCMYSYLDNELLNFKNVKIDLLVFGCTHYAVFDDYVENKYGYETLNMGSTVIQQLEEGNYKKVEILFTKLNDKIKDNVKNIINKEYEIKEINLEGVLK